MSCDLEELGLEQHSAVLETARQRDDSLDVVTRVDIIEGGHGEGEVVDWNWSGAGRSSRRKGREAGSHMVLHRAP